MAPLGSGCCQSLPIRGAGQAGGVALAPHVTQGAGAGPADRTCTKHGTKQEAAHRTGQFVKELPAVAWGQTSAQVGLVASLDMWG